MSKSPNQCIECGKTLAPGSAAERCRACVFSLAMGLDEDFEKNTADGVRKSGSPPGIDTLLLKTQTAAEVKLHAFGDYELNEETARGGMGVVFRAYQISTARTVALKFILGHRLESQDARRRFRQEAEAAARLNHPNIVSIYEAGEHQGHPFLCMQFIDGGTLANLYGVRQTSIAFGCPRKKRSGQVNAEARIPPTERSGHHNAVKGYSTPQLMARIARAIHYAHGRGVLHRDLKPSNILIDTHGDPFVTDFGLAKFSDTNSDLTRSATILGTPRYMSPEQCRGDQANVSTASDVYSLGVILYELLTGNAPFDGDSSMEVMRKVNEERPTAMNLHRKDRDLATICLKCLEKEPAQRYTSALALAEDLERFEGGEPITARPVGTLEGLWKWARRRPALVASLTAAAFALLLGTLISLWQAREANSARNDLSAHLYAADMGSVYQATLDGRLDRARLLLRRHIPEPGAEDHRGWEWRWFWQETQQQHVQLLEGNLWPLKSLAISPDESLIATGSEDGAIRIWDVATGKQLIIREGSGSIKALQFSPDGNWLACTAFHWEENGADLRIMVYDLTKPSEAPAFETKVNFLKRKEVADIPRFVREQLRTSILVFARTESGRRVLIHGGSTQENVPELRAWDFEAGSHTPLMDFEWGANLFSISPSGRYIAVARNREDGRDQIRVYRILTGQHFTFSSPLIGRVTSLGFSGSDKVLGMTVALDDAGRSAIALVNPMKGELVGKLSSLNNRHESLTFVGEESFVTTLGQTALHEWKLTGEGRTLAIAPGQILRGVGAGTAFRNAGHLLIAVAPEARWLATGVIDGHVRRWDLSTIRSIHLSQTEHTRSYPISAKLSRDSRFIAASSGRIEAPQEVLVWDHKAGRHVSALSGLPLWMAPTGKRLLTFTFSTGHSEDYAGEGFNGSLAELSEVVHWDVTVDPAEAAKRVPIKPKLNGVTVRMPFAEGTRAAVATATGAIHIVDTRTGVTTVLPEVSNAPVWGLAVSPNQRYLAFTGPRSGIVDLREMRLARRISSTRKVTNYRAFSPDSRFLAHAPSTNIIELYEMENQEAPPRIIYGHHAEIRNIAFSPDGKTMATGDHTGILKLWNVATWREMAEFTSSWHVEFSADGRCLITDGHFEKTDNKLTIRRAPSLKEIDLRIPKSL